MNEITYTPGRLARKLGISRQTLMRHLRNTGLIHQCFQTDNRYWRIPYKVVAEIASPEVLANNPPRRHRKSNSTPGEVKDEKDKVKRRIDILTGARDETNLGEYYGQIGKVLRQAGIS